MSAAPDYAIGPLRVSGAPPIDRARLAAHAAFETSGAARLMDVSPDGERALVVTAGELVELPARRVIASDATFGWARYGDGGIAWTADPRGDEHFEVMVDGVGRGSAVGEPVWRHGHLLAGRAAGEGIELVVDGAPLALGPGRWLPLDVSRDGAFALVRDERSSAESVVYRVELASGARVAIAHAEVAMFGDDGAIYAIADAGDRRGVIRIDRGAAWLVTQADADVTALAVHGGDVAYVVTGDDGVSTLHLNGRVVASGVIGDLRLADHVVAFSMADATHPRGAYRYDQGTLTAWLAPPESSGPVWEHVAIAPAIHTLVLRPPGAARAPVVLELHGGPEDRWLPRHDAFARWLASAGYAVVRPDVRGSAGHGRAWAAADDGARRGDVMNDLGAVLDWVARDPALDADRVIVVGTSYGGYLALSALIAFPDRLRGAATLGAITDLGGFLAGTAPERRAHRRAEYGDDPALLARLSVDASKLHRPVLIAHGARDPRVPLATAERFIAAARAAGVPVWSLIAADEGHAFEHLDTRAAFEVLVVQLADGTLRAPGLGACCSTQPSSKATPSRQQAPSR